MSFLVLCVLFLSNVFSEKVCKVVVVKAARYHTALIGDWNKLEELRNGQPVYKQNGKIDRWLWWKDHGAFSRWYFGTELGSKSVEAYRDNPAGDSKLFPLNPHKWHVVNNNKWVEDDQLASECKTYEEGSIPPPPASKPQPTSDQQKTPPNNSNNNNAPPPGQNKIIEIKGSKVANLNADYSYVGTNEDKAVFKSSNNLFIFWKAYKGYSRWYIGKKINDDGNVMAFIDSSAQSPEKIPRNLNWMELRDNDWSTNSKLTSVLSNASKKASDAMLNIRDKRHSPHRTPKGCSIILSNSRDTDVDKLFFIQDGEHNGRPYYKSNDDSFIYFVSFRGGHISRWHMSYPNGKLDDRVKAYANSKAETLDQMSKDDTWLVYDTNQNMWQQKPDLRIFCSDCTINIKNSLDSKVTGDYGITPFQNEGRPVWVNLPDQNRYIYFNAHKNYGRWMISLINGDIGGVVHGYVNSWAESPDLIDKYERWEEKSRGHRFRQSRLTITGNCGVKSALEATDAPDDLKKKESSDHLKKQCPENQEVKTEPKQKYSIVSWTDSDPGGEWKAHYGAGGMTPGSKFMLGTTSVQFTLQDKQGRQHVCEFTVTVKDEEPPNLFCPGDMHRTTRMNTNYQTVTWKDPYPYDNSLLPVDLAQIEGVKSGSQLTVGTHTVKYEATDHAKNKKQCSFRIFVRDREAPRLHNCPKDFTIQTYESSKWTAYPTWSLPTAKDNVDETVAVTRVAGIDPGTKISIGEKKERYSMVIIYQATDQAANRAECKFTINLVKNKQEKKHDAFRENIPVNTNDVGGQQTEEDMQDDETMEEIPDQYKRQQQTKGPHQGNRGPKGSANDQRKAFKKSKEKRRKRIWRIVFYVLIGLAIIAIIALVVLVMFSEKKTESYYNFNKDKGWCSCCRGGGSKRKGRSGKHV